MTEDVQKSTEQGDVSEASRGERKRKMKRLYNTRQAHFILGEKGYVLVVKFAYFKWQENSFSLRNPDSFQL